MPTGATVEERLIADVITTLEAISPGTGFNKSFAKVARQDRNAMTHPELPLAIVAQDGTTKDDDRLALIVATLRLVIVIVVNAKEAESWPTLLDLYTSDVENALRASTQRGGLAVKTAITRGDTYDSDELGSTYVVASQVLVEISFRHLYADTTTAI